MPVTAAIPYIISGISALAGLLGNRKSQTQQQEASSTAQDQTESGWGLTSQDQWSAPAMDPFQAFMRDYILQNLASRYSQGADLSGYEAGGLRDINRGSELKRIALNNMMTASGLSSSPAAANARSRIESERIGESIAFRNQIPLLQRQLQGQDLESLGNFFKSLPTGQIGGGTNYNQRFGTGTSRGTSTSTGTATQPGNMLGGLLNGLGGGLAPFLARMWSQNRSDKGNGQV